jgi:hypothetical protein
VARRGVWERPGKVRGGYIENMGRWAGRQGKRNDSRITSPPRVSVGLARQGNSERASKEG